MLYVIRGLSRDKPEGNERISIFIKNSKTGFYVTLRYPMNKLTTVDIIFKSILVDLKCKPCELTKASHVDFKKVGVIL